eukprot:s1778_g7.t1
MLTADCDALRFLWVVWITLAALLALSSPKHLRKARFFFVPGLCSPAVKFTMSAAPPPGGADPSGGLRRRPVHAHYDWHVAEADEGDCDDEDAPVFQEEQPSKFQEYMGIFFDYIFWILLAYCVVNAAIWMGEKMGRMTLHDWKAAAKAVPHGAEVRVHVHLN